VIWSHSSDERGRPKSTGSYRIVSLMVNVALPLAIVILLRKDSREAFS
jgi:hypothetical protein